MKFHTIIISAIEYCYIITKYQSLVYMVDSFLKMNVLYFSNGPYSILFKEKLFIVCKFIYFVHFIHTCIFINYYKTISLTTGKITSKSSFSKRHQQETSEGPARGPASVEGTGQHWGDRPASRGPQNQGDQPASRGLASVEGTSQHRRDRPASRGPASVQGQQQGAPTSQNLRRIDILQILSDLLYYLLLVRDATPVKTWIELTFLQQLRFKVNKIQVYSAGLDLMQQ